MPANRPDPTPEAIPYPEYALRVLFASFYPAVKMAVDFNYPLDTVKDMMTLALWREAKAKHSTINLISLIFGKSTRTVKALSARFNKGGFFNLNETNLMLRIEDLLRPTDRQAIKALDGGYPTRLVYDLGLYAKGGRTPIAVVHLEVSVQWDPWNQNYLVQSSLDGAKPTVRMFSLRNDAIKAATSLSLVVAKLSQVSRGESSVYFVHVVAQRNPLQAKSSGGAGVPRGTDRDLEVFSRWVGMFVRSRPKAEKLVEFRTHPFYVPAEQAGGEGG